MIETFDDLIAMAGRESEPAVLLACVLRTDALIAASGDAGSGVARANG